MNRWMCLWTVVLVGALRGSPAGREVSQAVVESSFVYETTSFPSARASALVETRAGTLIAKRFVGTAERNPDVGIWTARYEDRRWTTPVEVASGAQSSALRHPRRSSWKTRQGPSSRIQRSFKAAVAGSTSPIPGVASASGTSSSIRRPLSRAT